MSKRLRLLLTISLQVLAAKSLFWMGKRPASQPVSGLSGRSKGTLSRLVRRSRLERFRL